MTDILDDLRAYLAGDNSVVMSPRRINEMIAAFDGLRRQLEISRDAHNRAEDTALQYLSECNALRAELAAERNMRRTYQCQAAELSDKLNGTPCAEIRWRQENDELRELLRNLYEYGTDPFSLDDDFVERIDAALKGGEDE